MRRGGQARWMGPGGAALLSPAVVTAAAMLTAAAALMAGCGRVTSGGLPPRARPAVPSDPEPVGGPPAGSRSQARAFAQELLSRLVLPPGPGQVHLRALPQLLRQPQIPSGSPHQADVHEVFSLRQPMAAVQSFLKAHVPAGMRWNGTGKGWDPSGVTMYSLSFTPHSLPEGVSEAELVTAVVPAAGGGSLLRADAEAIWYPHRTAAEYLNARRYRAVRVTVMLFNPRPRTVTRTVTSGSVIARLAGLANGLPGAPYQPPSCPAILATVRFTFVPAVPAAATAVVSPTGCLTVDVTVGGVAQRRLWGDGSLITAAMRLLRVKSLV